MLNKLLLRKEYFAPVILFLIFLAIFGVSVYQTNHSNKLKSNIEYYNKLKKELLELESQYNKIKLLSKTQNIRFLKGQSLFSLVDKITRKNLLSSNVVFIRPFSKTINERSTLEMVEIKMKNMNMKAITKFLYDIEVKYKGVIFLKRINITKENNGALSLNAVFFMYKDKRKSSK
jgi:hypothetical protein